MEHIPSETYSTDQKPPGLKPTIGRIVHYQKFGTPGGEHQSEPSPAIITRVNDDDTCDLFVMNPTGCYFNRTPYWVEPKAGHWNWPPRD
jgi:hypothetical protein